MLCRDFVDYSDTIIIDKKRFEEMTMPRCDIVELMCLTYCICHG